MRLVVLIIALLLPAYAWAEEVVQVVGLALTMVGGWWAVLGYALMIGSSVYGADQARRQAGAQREQQRAAYNAGLRDRTITRVATDAPHRIIYGKARVGSDIVAMFTSGNRDQYRWLVCAHAAHECDGVEEYYIAGKALGTLDVDGYVTGGDYLYQYPVDETESHTGAVFNLAHTPVSDACIRITYWVGSIDNGIQYNMPFTRVGTEITVSESQSFTVSYQWTNSIPRVRVIPHLGTAADTADAALMAAVPTKWLATDVLRGYCYSIVMLDLTQAEFQSGIPPIEVLVRGAKLYDPRSGLTVYNSNPALASYHYLTSDMCGIEASDIPLDDVITAANVCDEAITIGGASAARYTINGTVTADQDPQKVLEQLAQSMAGGIVRTTWRMWAGKYVAPVMTLSHEDVVGAWSTISGTPDADLYNGVRGQYIDPANTYVVTDFKPYQNTVYVSGDGRELWQNIDFPFTDHVQRVRNLCRIFTEDQRNGFTFKGTFSLKAWSLKVGQRVTFTSEFLGQTAKVYRVTDKRFGPTQGVELTLKEDAASIWDAADAVELDETPNTDMPNPFAIAPLASIACSSGTDTLLRNTDGTITSRILVEWPLATTQGVVHGGYIEVEYRRIGQAAWNKVTITGDELKVYLAGLKDGVWYNIRARTVNPVLNLKSIWLYTTHQVVGKTERPTAVSAISATPDAQGVVLLWEEIADPDRMDYLICDDTGGMLVWNAFAGSTAKLPAATAGSHTYRIVSRDTSKLTALTEATCVIAINAPSAPVIGSAVKDGMIELSWNDCLTTHQVKNYEIRHGASWAAGTFVGRSDTRSLRITPDWTGSRTFWVAGIDIAGNVGTAGSEVVAVTAPTAPNLTGIFAADSAKLSWDKPSSVLPVDMYEIRYGSTWAGGTSLGTFRVTSHSVKADWVGSRTFWVAAIDLAGNVGTPDSLEMIVTAAAAPTITTQIIDNNVLLYWSQVAGTLPTVTYELRKGATWAGAEVIGTKAGGFTSVFETQSGQYKYWLAAIDSAGNYGTPGAVDATVAQPPDYVLKSDYDSDLSGTKSNMALHGDADGSYIAPVNTTETFADHFINNSWATPQAQIDAGYPVYAQPNLSPAYYEEVIDYGTLLASNRITVTLTALDVVGLVARSCRISVSTDGVSYTDYDGVWQVYATNFRYVKVRVTFTASNSTDLIEVSALNIRLDSKLKTVTKMVDCVAGDAGGTAVYLTDDWTITGNKLFIDVDAIALTPQGTTPVTPTYDFTDAPDPLSLKILLFDNAGARVSGTCSMTVRGF